MILFDGKISKETLIIQPVSFLMLEKIRYKNKPLKKDLRKML
jgi:hypothetical protein